MVVNPVCLSCSEKQLTALVSISRIVAYSLILLVYSGCNRAQASREKDAAKARAESPSLKLTSDQMAFIERNITNLIAADTYWTWPDADVDPFYLANAGSKVPVKYISFECAVIVWVGELRKVSVGYVKMPDGHLDYPASVDYWTSGPDDIEDLVKSGKMRPGNWDRFVMMLDYERELSSAREQEDKYRTQFTSRKAHLVTNAEITLPPLGPPRYDPMNETKELLLERILKESAHQADMMFEKQESVSITVPDFNVGESFVWVLIQNKEGGAIVSIDLTTDPKEHPVFFGGVVTYDIRANRYGLGREALTTKMIRQHALKIIRYTVKSPAQSVWEDRRGYKQRSADITTSERRSRLIPLSCTLLRKANI